MNRIEGDVCGTKTGYFSRGCRCEPCRAAGAEDQRARYLRDRASGPREDTKHGTTTGYTNFGCRCDECKAAISKYNKTHRKKLRATDLPGGDPRHGTLTGYFNYRCRCDPCADVGVAYSREVKFKKRYGISSEEFESRFDSQSRKCAVCFKSEFEGAAVDHDHETGKIRGILCRPCNSAIGMLGDDIEGLERALAYLERVRLID